MILQIMITISGALLLFPDHVTSIEPQFILPHRGCYILSETLNSLSGEGFKLSDVHPNLCTYVTFGFGFVEGNELQISRTDEEHIQIMSMMRKVNPTMLVLLALDLGQPKAAEQLTSNLIYGQNRSDFITTVVEKLRLWSLDGIVLHVENVKPTSGDTTGLLIKELRAKFNQESAESALPRLALISHVGISPKNSQVDPTLLASESDFIQIRSWDFNTPETEPSKTGHNAPLYHGLSSSSLADPFHNIEHSFLSWEKSGVPKSKLVLGIAFYGHAWNLGNKNRFESGAPADGKAPASGYSNTKGILYYHDICEQIRDGNLTKVFDSDGMVPFAHNNETVWVSYDDPETARIKARWVLEKNYSGIFFWDMSMEDFNGTCGSPFSIMKAVSDILSGSTQNKEGEKLDCDRKFCGKRGSGVYALSSCNDTYCQCDNSGKAFSFTCGPGTVFDSLILGCNYAYACKKVLN